MKKIKIIIVDDHILFGEGIRAILSAEPDFEVVALASSAQEAIGQTLALKPDIVLMDFCLPDGSGVEATRAIMAEYPQCKIIFLTMSENDEDLFAAVRSGAKGFIQKSVSTAKLKAAIRSVQEGEGVLSPNMTLRVMGELARTKAVEAQPDPRLSKLTSREMDVLKELAAGRTNLEIAARLVVAENTVKYHVHSILTKLGLNDRRLVADMVRDYGIIKSSSDVFFFREDFAMNNRS